MTSNIDPWYGVTVSHGKKFGPRQWRATARLFRRDTHARVGDEFSGEGTTMGTADDAALRAATVFADSLGEPEDWSGLEGGYRF